MLSVYFCRSAFRDACTEMTKWYRIGMGKKGKPFEAVAFPLSHIILKSGSEKNPAETLDIKDVESFIITHVVIPPDEIKNYSPYRANFKKRGKDTEKFSQLFAERKTDPLVRRYPLLGIFSRIHSHPFGKMNVNSEGDLKTCLRDEIETRNKGLLFSVSFIMTPKRIDRGNPSWNISGYAVNGGQQEQVEIKFISEKDLLIKAAKQQPYYKKSEGVIWESEIESYLTSNTERFEKNRLSRGWTSFWIRNVGRELILLVPPFFPKDALRAYDTDDGRTFRNISADYLKIFGTDNFPEANFIGSLFQKIAKGGCPNE